MKNKRIILLLLLLLVGCSKQGLSSEKSNFSSEGVSGTVQLPESWESVTNYRQKFNEAAIFGAEDTKTNSYLFIRLKKNARQAQETLDELSLSILKKTFQMSEADFEKLNDLSYPTIRYSFDYRFEKKTVKAIVYYQQVANDLIEYIFYSAQDNQLPQRIQQFDQTVATSVIQKVESKSSDHEATGKRVLETDQYSFNLTSYKVIPQTENHSLVIIRFVFTNKGPKLQAATLWQSVIQATQAEQPLAISTITDFKEVPDLNYLVENSHKKLNKGDALESAIVYELNDKTKADITLTLIDPQAKEPKQFIVPIVE